MTLNTRIFLKLGEMIADHATTSELVGFHAQMRASDGMKFRRYLILFVIFWNSDCFRKNGNNSVTCGPILANVGSVHSQDRGAHFDVQIARIAPELRSLGPVKVELLLPPESGKFPIYEMWL